MLVYAECSTSCLISETSSLLHAVGTVTSCELGNQRVYVVPYPLKSLFHIRRSRRSLHCIDVLRGHLRRRIPECSAFSPRRDYLHYTGDLVEYMYATTPAQQTLIMSALEWSFHSLLSRLRDVPVRMPKSDSGEHWPCPLY